MGETGRAIKGTTNHRSRYIGEDSRIERERTALPVYLILKTNMITVGNPLWPQPLSNGEEWE